MKAKVVSRKLKEALDNNSILDILKLIGEAHDKIMDAQDLLNDLKEDNDDELLDALEYDVLDDLEASLSEFDFMGEDNPLEALKEKVL